MAARNIAEIISLDSHARTVRFGQNEEDAGPSRKERQPDLDQLRAAASVINHLFSELQSCFPAWRQTFTSKADIDAAKRVWARGLVEAGIHSEQQLQWGLRKARRSESPFWPSVGQFIKWCQPDPASYGLPNSRQAYLEACRNAHRLSEMTNEEWSHAAVYVALKNTGTFDIRNRKEAETWPIFERNYEIAVRRALAGEDLNVEIPKALPPRPAPRPVDPEVAKQHLERLKRCLRAGK
ncbi:MULTISPECIES: replication protein P [Shewanella]|uniref:replication protein P n=1 Tax=Shewanella TaxID=22 RepID=UPI00159602CA|nr:MULTISPECIES: replication protein P [Gammaproteobacteria]EKF9762309.1 replication protein P [Vibrio cholerae]ELJ8607880.1 replication protein P [Vibrio cholerae]